MKLLVITFSTNAHDIKVKPLVESLQQHGYDYQVLSGPQYSWGGNNLALIATWLRSNRADYTHFLYTDAWDTVALAPPDEVIEKYTAHNNTWLYSGEKNCYPRGDWAPHYNEATGAWRFLNAGGYITPIDLFLTVERDAIRETENDQEHGSHNYLFNNNNRISIDTGCNIFQTLYAEDSSDFAFTRNRRLINRKTNTQPVFIHGNGKADMQWLYRCVKNGI